MLAHTHDRAVHVDIFAARHFGVEAGADFQEAGYAALGADAASGGGGDAAQQLEQGALAGAVLADDAHHLALLYREGDMLQGPHIIAGRALGAVVGDAYLLVWVFMAQDLGLPPPVEVVAEGTGAYQAEAIELANVVEFDHCIT